MPVITMLLKIIFSHIDVTKNCSITHRKSDRYDIPEEKFRLSKSFFNSLLVRTTSRCKATMILLEHTPSYELRSPLPAARMPTNADDQLEAVRGTAISKTVRFDALVQPFIGAELRGSTPARGSGADVLNWRRQTLWQ